MIKMFDLWQKFVQGVLNMNIWNDEEVKALFSLVQKQKELGKPLREVFCMHAKKFGRKPNSVRNYYYKEVENLQSDSKRCSNLGIEISKHNKMHFVPFSEEEKMKLVNEVDNLVAGGMSVRTACQKMSCGDVTLMTRLQNKYQNLKKSGKKNNIIVFRQKQKSLSENDINSLFLGLVKLIKKTAIDEFMEKTRLEKESSAFLLKKAFVDLSRKEKEIKALKEEFSNLKAENASLQTKLEGLMLDKNQLLKAHFQKKQQRGIAQKLK